MRTGGARRGRGGQAIQSGPRQNLGELRVGLGGLGRLLWVPKRLRERRVGGDVRPLWHKRRRRRRGCVRDACERGVLHAKRMGENMGPMRRK